MTITQKFFSETRSHDACPDTETLSWWAEGAVTGDDRQKLITHTAKCSRCQSVVASVSEWVSQSPEKESLPKTLKDKVLKRFTQRSARPQWQRILFHPHLWLGLFLLFFTSSFVVTSYYKQFLILALICGGKWLLESRSSKTNITWITKKEVSTNQRSRWDESRLRDHHEQEKDL